MLKDPRVKTTATKNATEYSLPCDHYFQRLSKQVVTCIMLYIPNNLYNIYNCVYILIIHVNTYYIVNTNCQLDWTGKLHEISQPCA